MHPDTVKNELQADFVSKKKKLSRFNQNKFKRPQPLFKYMRHATTHIRKMRKQTSLSNWQAPPAPLMTEKRSLSTNE